MGCNFYFVRDPCPHCGRGEDSIHIGKSSMGWCFSLHVHPDLGINTLEDWKKTWINGIIKDEYGEKISHNMMLDRIIDRSGRPWDERQWGDPHSTWYYGYKNEADFHARNHSVRGPKGLLRHQIDNTFCIGHGEGTWDYLIGDFS